MFNLIPNPVEERNSFGIQEEVWWEYPFKNGYEISTWGKVKSHDQQIVIRSARARDFTVTRKGKILKPWDNHGYEQINLRKDLKISVHTLVLETFVGSCPEGMECRHLDGNPKNNRLDNLCWGTQLEQHEDRNRHGTGAATTVRKGDDCPYSKLTSEIVLEIRRLYATGKYPQSKLGRMFSLHQVTISNITMRKIWKSV